MSGGAGGPRRTPRIFLLDNYDSFTYNLVQYLMELGAEVIVKRNDEVTAREVMQGGYDGAVISPGPGRPEEAGITPDLVAMACGELPLLGVCLGHQAIGQHFGARVVRAGRPMHGKTSSIEHDGLGIFAGMPRPFEATRYHSLVIEPGSMAAELKVSATAADSGGDVIMGVRHARWPQVAVEGVQFHPESILTQGGRRLMGNFLSGIPAR